MPNKFLLHILKKYKIRTQLLLIYIVALLIPLIVIASVFIIYSRTILSNYYNGLLEADNLRVSSIFSELTSQAYSISNEIANDKNLNKLVKYQYYIPDNYNKNRKEVTVFEDIAGYQGIKKVRVYSDNKHFYDSEDIYVADKYIKNSDWFKKASNDPQAFWCRADIENYTNQICLIRPIVTGDKHNHSVLVMIIDEDYLKNKIQLENDIIQIKLNNNEILYQTNMDDAGYNIGTRMKIEKSVSLYGTSTTASVICFDKDAVYLINLIIFVEVLVVILVLALSFFLLRVFRDLFISRIWDLRDAMHQASIEDYDISNYELIGQDEVAEAFEDLKIMIDQIKAKDAEVYETVIKQRELDNRQKEMEFEMLASKINPHFLYNTLESIRMKAFTNGDKDVAVAIKLLGKSLRYVLENTGTQYTTLEKEIEHVNTYLEIQKLRFGDRFDTKITIQEGIDISSIKILPLLLQPVVENSILHALEEIERGGLIEMSVLRDENRYVIKVSDNGPGMSEAELNSLIEDIRIKNISNKNSIGLYNINQRLSLAYGPEYALKIDSKRNEGTTVQIYIPIEK